MLATEWNQVEPTTWEFTLREGVTFQDGTPMDAEAVAGALTHVLDVPTPARAFNADVVSEVSAIDESTVQITTPKPDPLVPLRVASPNAGILAPKAYQGKQIDIVGTCTGPFTVTEEVPRQSLTLEANDDYWGGEVALDIAEVRFIIDGATRATQLQTGEAQIAKSLPVASLAALEGDSNLEISELELTRTTVMLLNNSARRSTTRWCARRSSTRWTPRRSSTASTKAPARRPSARSARPRRGRRGCRGRSVDLDEARALLDQAGCRPRVPVDRAASPTTTGPSSATSPR